MSKVAIETPSKCYSIHITNDGIISFAKEASLQFPQSKFMLITDENVSKLYLDQVVAAFQLAGLYIISYTVPAGESSKSIEHYYHCQTACLEAGLGRQDIIIALGGGVIGDLAGFVAATYMRGIRYVQMPTTLLAHDSAVGGKVAINHDLGKNMIGAFHQPEAVYYHLPFLDTLPEAEWRSGLAEVVKEALIADETFLAQLMSEVKKPSDFRKNEQAYITKAIQIKAAIVAEDETEVGRRVVLNFGHTLGHAIEKELQIPHGEAVAFGMVFALQLSQELSSLQFDYLKFVNWMRQLGYFQFDLTQLQVSELIHYIKKDKKNKAAQISFVVLEAVGEPALVLLEQDFVEAKISKFIRNRVEQI